MRLRGSPFALINDWARFGSQIEALEYHKLVEQQEAEVATPAPQARGQPVQVPGIPQTD
jgi:hypothetical protein